MDCLLFLLGSGRGAGGKPVYFPIKHAFAGWAAEPSTRAELEECARSSVLSLVGPPLANSRQSNLQTQRPFYHIPFQLSMILATFFPACEWLGGIVETEVDIQTEIANLMLRNSFGCQSITGAYFEQLICSMWDSTPYLSRIRAGMEISGCEPPARRFTPFSSCSSSFRAAPLWAKWRPATPGDAASYAF